MEDTLPNKATLIDITVIYKDNYFDAKNLPENLPERFVLRFTAPSNYTQGDKIRIDDTEITIVIPTAPDEPAPDGIFAAGALVSFDIDLNSDKAVFKSGAGGGGGTIEIGYTARVTTKIRELTSIPSARTNMPQCVIDSELIGVCGSNGSAYDNFSVLAYNYVTNTSRSLQTMAGRHANTNMGCAIGEEAIAVCGYQPGQYVNHAANEAVNIKTNTKRTLVQLATPRATTAIVVVKDEIIIPAGASSGAPQSSIEGLIPATNTKRTLSVSLSAGLMHIAAGNINDSIVVAGGEKDNGVTFVKTIEYVNPITNTKMVLSTTLSYVGSASGHTFTVAGNKFVVMLNRTSSSSQALLKNIDVINPITDTKRSFSLPYDVSGTPQVYAVNDSEVVIDYNALNYPESGTNSQLLVILNVDTGDKRIISTKTGGSWNSFIANVFGNEYVKAGGGMTGENPTAQVQGVNLGDAGDISVPYLFVDTTVTSSIKLDTAVKIPYPATYKDADYSANTKIPMADSNIFNLKLPAGTETAEIKYIVQKGAYHL